MRKVFSLLSCLLNLTFFLINACWHLGLVFSEINSSLSFIWLFPSMSVIWHMMEGLLSRWLRRVWRPHVFVVHCDGLISC